MRAYEDVELFAWIGPDDSITGVRTEEIGIKRAIVPAGTIPMVAVDRDKMEQPLVAEQMKLWAKATGVPRVLARFRLVEILRTEEPT